MRIALSLLLISLTLQAHAFDEVGLFNENDTPESVENYTPEVAKASECHNVINPKKILLFIDTNSAYRELLRAKKAACNLGLHFETIPGEEISRKTGVALESFYILREQATYYEERCKKNTLSCNSAKLKEIQEKRDAAEKIAQTLGRTYAYYAPGAMNRLFERLNTQSAKVVSMVISGHHNEYGFWSEYLLTSKDYDEVYGVNGRSSPLSLELKEVLHDGGSFGNDFTSFSKGYQSLFSELSTLGLWGCSGVTIQKIKEFKKLFPSIKMIGGFNSSAPSSIRESSQNFLESFLNRSREIYSLHSPSEIKEALLSLRDFTQSFSGAYVSFDDNQQQYFLSVTGPAENRSKATVKYESLGSQLRCIGFLASLPKYIEQIERYDQGIDQIPVDNSNSRLWDIYFKLQINTDCYVETEYYDRYKSSRVGLLRFFDGVKKNFTQTFKRELDAAQNEMRWNFDINDTRMQRLLKSESLSSFIFNRNRAEIIALSNLLKTHQYNFSYPALMKLSVILKRYLIELHPEFTEMLAWHQYNPGSPPPVTDGR